MKSVFLGPWTHWLMLLAIVALGWAAGRLKLHVTDFNLFVIAALALTAAVIAAVLMTSSPGRRITRDVLEDDSDH